MGGKEILSIRVTERGRQAVEVTQCNSLPSLSKHCGSWLAGLLCCAAVSTLMLLFTSGCCCLLSTGGVKAHKQGCLCHIGILAP